MDNKQAKEVLEKWKCRGSDGLTDERLGYIEGWYHKKDDVAFEMAIKSLDMRDKVKKDILSRSIIKPHSDGLKVIPKSTCDIYLSGFSDGLESAFDIIEKYKKEIEE